MAVSKDILNTIQQGADRPDAGNASDRDKKIIRTSVIGILANVFLAAFKAVVGLTSNSIAIVMDAVNNLSDAASSVITIVGTKLAGREADRKHPYVCHTLSGHPRNQPPCVRD